MMFDFGFEEKLKSKIVKIWLYKNGFNQFSIEANRKLLKDIVQSLKDQQFYVSFHCNDQGVASIKSLPGFDVLEVAERIALTLENHGYIVERYAMDRGQMLSDTSPIQSFVLA